MVLRCGSRGSRFYYGGVTAVARSPAAMAASALIVMAAGSSVTATPSCFVASPSFSSVSARGKKPGATKSGEIFAGSLRCCGYRYRYNDASPAAGAAAAVNFRFFPHPVMTATVSRGATKARRLTALTSSLTTEGGEAGGTGVIVAGGEETGGSSGQMLLQRKRDVTKTALLSVFGEELALNGDSRLGREAVGAGAAEAPPSKGRDPVLVCPSTLGDLTEGFRSFGGVGPGAFSVTYKATSKLPGVRYEKGRIYTDFVDDGRPAWRLSRSEAVKEGTFQSPLVSWLYERGWRQSFSTRGFPGVNEEFVQVKNFFTDTGADTGVVMDMSCGSGLMMRRLVSSKRYRRVIGGDLSPTMLKETARRFKENGLDKPELIRCDVSRLPLRTESLDGAHAGAALHCWTRLEESIAEVYRVLKPGRGFFATTFLRSDRSQQGGGYTFFEVEQLEGLMLDAGFTSVKVSKSGSACAIIRAVKEK